MENKNITISNICAKKMKKDRYGNPTGEHIFLNVGIMKEFENGGKTIEFNHNPDVVYQVFPRKEREEIEDNDQ